jgi:hypothetical protein
MICCYQQGSNRLCLASFSASCIAFGHVEAGRGEFVRAHLDAAVVRCQNSPLVATVRVTSDAGSMKGCETKRPSLLEPRLTPVSRDNYVRWSRLLPVGLSSDVVESILQRSHHAMAYIRSIRLSGMKGSDAVYQYILWSGFDKNMATMEDLWSIYVYPPGLCTQLRAEAWWREAWCWTAREVLQIGDVPSGRAYAKLAVLHVRSTFESFKIFKDRTRYRKTD